MAEPIRQKDPRYIDYPEAPEYIVHMSLNPDGTWHITGVDSEISGDFYSKTQLDEMFANLKSDMQEYADNAMDNAVNSAKAYSDSLDSTVRTWATNQFQPKA